MKKTIKTILATVLVMTIIFGGILVYFISWHNRILSEAETEVRQAVDVLQTRYITLKKDYSELKTEMEDLESDVYDVMTGNDYSISIEHDGQKHTWTKEKDNWLFSKTSYSVDDIL